MHDEPTDRHAQRREDRRNRSRHGMRVRGRSVLLLAKQRGTGAKRKRP